MAGKGRDDVGTARRVLVGARRRQRWSEQVWVSTTNVRKGWRRSGSGQKNEQQKIRLENPKDTRTRSGAYKVNESRTASENGCHFLLTNILLETMKSTARESQKEGRIVIVSSEAHRWFGYPEGVRFDKINDESSFRTMYAYGQSKLANILHANELAKHFKAGILDMYNCRGMGSVHEVLSQTCLNLTGVLNKVAKYFFKSIPQGAATTCYVALHPQVKGVSGEYFSDSNLAKPIALAKDEELAKKLWDFSLSLTDSK
ncbi:hypothetical protein RHGRI_005875 [Rhododendron griersonianum]|uniref:Uncharacterized protein n=1 Tax=Rhododendron griersonianum TaxID=479676 RepID=A0AAV6LEW8_9ERIC|nr:hypothetical protein RHGRI_005875 [Rhododendron griersonianum]